MKQSGIYSEILKYSNRSVLCINTVQKQVHSLIFRWLTSSEKHGCQALFSNDDVSVALDVAQLVAVEVNHQLSQPRMGGSEVNFHLGIIPGSH